MITWILGSGLVALVVIYMTYPRFQNRILSSARFFRHLPPPRKGQSRLRLAKPQLTLPFFLQLFALLFLLAAVVWAAKTFKAAETKGTGLWLILDTSASMSTIQEGETRMNAAVQEVETILKQTKKQTKTREVCINLSFMDMERRDWLMNSDANAVRQVLHNLEPRPLGTDAGIARGILNSMRTQSPSAAQCPVTHLVVITDLPAPPWIPGEGETRVIWRDIGKKTDNIGFTGIQAIANPLTGLVAEVNVEVTAFGTPPNGAKVSVTAPGNSTIMDKVLNWSYGRPWRGSFRPTQPGLYHMQLSPGGAYAYDDIAVIEIGKEQTIRVDWQLRNDRLLQQMGWTRDSINPHLRVISVLKSEFTGSGKIPTLVVGEGYRRGGKPVIIGDFIETSPLIQDLNFDALESLEIGGTAIPGEVQPVLRGTGGEVWAAQSSSPPMAFVPGLPTGTDDVAGRVSATVFFNALRWLLQERSLPPLYTLTAPHRPKPGGNRLVLHKDEGNTDRVSRSFGDLDDLEPVPIKGTAPPLWPVLLAAAVILFLIERTIVITRRLKG